MKKRGQAFETMMLVISVIVAVAILSILLGFIGRIGPGIGGDAVTTMTTQLKSVQSKGYGSSTIERATFKEGIIRTGDLIVELPLAKGDVKFDCLDDGICGADEPLEQSSDQAKITVNKAVTGYITTCKEDGGPYWIVIGSDNQKDEVNTACDTHVG